MGSTTLTQGPVGVRTKRPHIPYRTFFDALRDGISPHSRRAVVPKPQVPQRDTKPTLPATTSRSVRLHAAPGCASPITGPGRLGGYADGYPDRLRIPVGRFHRWPLFPAPTASSKSPTRLR